MNGYLGRGVHTKLPQQLNNPNNSNNYDQCSIETYEMNYAIHNPFMKQSIQYTDECKIG